MPMEWYCLVTLTDL